MLIALWPKEANTILSLIRGQGKKQTRLFFFRVYYKSIKSPIVGILEGKEERERVMGGAGKYERDREDEDTFRI